MQGCAYHLDTVRSEAGAREQVCLPCRAGAREQACLAFNKHEHSERARVSGRAYHFAGMDTALSRRTCLPFIRRGCARERVRLPFYVLGIGHSAEWVRFWTHGCCRRTYVETELRQEKHLARLCQWGKRGD